MDQPLVVVVGADRHAVVNSCAGTKVMEDNNEKVSFLFCQGPSMIEASFYAPADIGGHLKKAYMIDNNRDLAMLMMSEFGTASVDKLLQQCQERFKKLTLPLMRKPLPELLACLDKVCVEEASKSAERHKVYMQILTVQYELNRIFKKRGNKMRWPSSPTNGGVPPFANDAKERIAYLQKKQLDLNQQFREINARHHYLPLGDLIEYIQISIPSFKHSTTSIFCASSLCTFQFSEFASLQAIVLCTTQPASETTTDLAVRRLWPLIARVPTRQTPTFISHSTEEKDNREEQWKERVQTAMVRLMALFSGVANARLCALADRIKTRAIVVDNLSDIPAAIDGAKQEPLLEETLSGTPVKFETPTGLPFILTEELTRRLCNSLFSNAEKVIGETATYVSRFGEIRPYNSSTGVLQAMPQAIAAVESVLLDLFCDSVAGSLPNVHKSLPKNQQWRFALDAECTPAYLAAEMDKAIAFMLGDIVFQKQVQLLLQSIQLEQPQQPQHQQHHKFLEAKRQKQQAQQPQHQQPQHHQPQHQQHHKFLVAKRQKQQPQQPQQQPQQKKQFVSLKGRMEASVRQCAEKLSMIMYKHIQAGLGKVWVAQEPLSAWMPFAASPTTLATIIAASQATAPSATVSDMTLITRRLSELPNQLQTDDAPEVMVDRTMRDFMLAYDPETGWTAGDKAYQKLLDIRCGALMRKAKVTASPALRIVNAVGVVERCGSVFHLPKGLFTIIFCSSIDVLQSVYNESGDCAYCIVPPHSSVRQHMTSLCETMHLPYWLRLPMLPPDFNIFYETISPSPLLPLRRLPLCDPFIAIKQMARLLETIHLSCDGVLFGDYTSATPFKSLENIVFGIFNVNMRREAFVTSRFNCL